MRLFRGHALAFQYVDSHRDFYPHGQGHRNFSEGVATVSYTYLTDTRLGAVEWRD